MSDIDDLELPLRIHLHTWSKRSDVEWVHYVTTVPDSSFGENWTPDVPVHEGEELYAWQLDHPDGPRVGYFEQP